eukprot:evm.model.scf_289.1 EVM.evm.TU.scf_289.1   scf_289:2107-7216(-)
MEAFAVASRSSESASTGDYAAAPASGSVDIPVADDSVAIPPGQCRLWLMAAPPVGSVATQGLRPGMEDAGTVVENLLEAPLLFRPGESVVPPAVEGGLSGLWDAARPGRSADTVPRRVEARFLFAGVYDGHGGAEVSRELAGKLHQCLRLQFARALAREEESGSGGGGWGGGHPGLGLEAVAQAVQAAVHMMDRSLDEALGEAQSVGSTAVVALVSRWHVCLANCGDSRAVLCRSRAAYRMTRDHKPDMDDERERIVRKGGMVVDLNGPRVMGMLAMSRALGDHCLRSAGVVPDPEITIVGRSPGDEFLVLATDGLWDVVSDEEACSLASRCFERASKQDGPTETAARVAARVLMKAAMDRGSRDNITVTVIDLRYNNQPQE